MIYCDPDAIGACGAECSPPAEGAMWRHDTVVEDFPHDGESFQISWSMCLEPPLCQANVSPYNFVSSPRSGGLIELLLVPEGAAIDYILIVPTSDQHRKDGPEGDKSGGCIRGRSQTMRRRTWEVILDEGTQHRHSQKSCTTRLRAHASAVAIFLGLASQ